MGVQGHAGQFSRALSIRARSGSARSRGFTRHLPDAAPDGVQPISCSLRAPIRANQCPAPAFATMPRCGLAFGERQPCGGLANSAQRVWSSRKPAGSPRTQPRTGTISRLALTIAAAARLPHAPHNAGAFALVLMLSSARADFVAHCYDDVSLPCPLAQLARALQPARAPPPLPCTRRAPTWGLRSLLGARAASPATRRRQHWPLPLRPRGPPAELVGAQRRHQDRDQGVHEPVPDRHADPALHLRHRDRG